MFSAWNELKSSDFLFYTIALDPEKVARATKIKKGLITTPSDLPIEVQIAKFAEILGICSDHEMVHLLQEIKVRNGTVSPEFLQRVAQFDKRNSIIKTGLTKAKNIALFGPAIGMLVASSGLLQPNPNLTVPLFKLGASISILSAITFAETELIKFVVNNSADKRSPRELQAYAEIPHQESREASPFTIEVLNK